MKTINFNESKKLKSGIKSEKGLKPGKKIKPAEELESGKEMDPPRELESPSMEEDHELPPGKTSVDHRLGPDESREQKELITCRDFIDNLYIEQESCEKDEIRAAICYQIGKITTALSVFGLSPDDAKVKQMDGGVLGLYNTKTQEIALSLDMLSDFSTDSQLLKTVVAHEKKAHKDKKILDEGLAELYTERITNAVSGIYEQPKADARRTFYDIGIPKVLELYDIKHPEKLFEIYLKLAVIKKFKTEKKALQRVKDNITSRDKIADDETKKLVSKFSKGAEELMEKLKCKNYNIKNKVKEILLALADEELD